LLSQDRNPNTNGAKIMLGLEGTTGASLEAIAASVAEGRIKALVVLGEDPTEFGITVEQLKKLPSFITMNILRNAATAHATAILPSAAYAEKRGSMINGRGRLQRLNRSPRAGARGLGDLARSPAGIYRQ
jgi:NADH-quinone oxidoreductase subunit G